MVAWNMLTLLPVPSQATWVLVGFSFVVCVVWALIGWYRHTRADQLD
jgi:hypothetical protein